MTAEREVTIYCDGAPRFTGHASIAGFADNKFRTNREARYKASPDGSLSNDWDGEVHTDRAAADESLAECHAAGWPDYKLYELRPVT